MHARRKESCCECVVFDEEMCDRKGPEVQTCQEAGFSAEQTSSVSPIKKRAAEKTCVCMQACTHVQQSLCIQFIWETALDSSSYPALLLGWHAVSLAVRASQLTWQLDLLISVSYTSPFFYFHALFS